MRPIRHGLPTLYHRTVDAIYFARNCDRNVSTAAIPRFTPLSSSFKGKEKALDIESGYEQGLLPGEREQKELGVVKCLYCFTSEFEAITQVHDELFEAPVNLDSVCQPSARGLARAQRNRTTLQGHMPHFFESPRLPPLPTYITDAIVAARKHVRKRRSSYPTHNSGPSARPLSPHSSLPPVSLPKDSGDVPTTKPCISRKRKPRKRQEPHSLDSIPAKSSNNSLSIATASHPTIAPPSHRFSTTSCFATISSKFEQGRRRNSASSLTSGFKPTPLPLSHGFGEVKERAERYRNVIEQKQKSAQEVLHGLNGKDDTRQKGSINMIREDNSSHAEWDLIPACPFRHRRPPFPLSHRITNLHTPPIKRVFRFSQRYSTSSYSGGSAAEDPSPSTAVPKGLRTAPHEYFETSSFNPSPISGFSTGWKGEEWKDEWEVDSLAFRRLSTNGHVVSSPTYAKKASRPLRFQNIKGLPHSKHERRFRSIPRPSVPNSHHLVGTSEAEKIGPLRSGHGSNTALAPTQHPQPDPADDRFVSRLRALLKIPDTTGNKHSAQDVSNLGENQVQTRLPPTLPVSEPVIIHHPSFRKVLTKCEAGPSPFELLAAVRDFTRDVPLRGAIPEADAFVKQISMPLRRKAFHDPNSSKNASFEKPSELGEGEKEASLVADKGGEIASNNARKRILKLKAKQESMSRVLAAVAQQRKKIRALWKLKKAEAQEHMHVGELKPLTQNILEDVPPHQELRPIPRLAHGLDRVLFNQSVHWIQDPHSRVFNFSPNLQSLPAVTDFAFERLGPYVSSSQDEDLHALAVRYSKSFTGSTSSLTKVLSHIYFLISGDRWVDTSSLSMAFFKEPRTFTPGMRMPATITMHHRRNFLDANGEPISPPTGAAAGQGSEEVPQLLKVESSPPPSSPAAARSNVSERKDPSMFSLGNEEQAGMISSSAGALANSPACQEAKSEGVSRSSLESDLFSAQEEEFLASFKSEWSLSKSLYWVDGNTTRTTATAEDRVDRIRPFDTYAVDSGYGDPQEKREAELNVLLWLGTMAEKFLTMSEPSFRMLLRKNPASGALVEDKRREAYRYCKSSEFVMRSQLDCQDSRLPGTGVFDIKTRAVLPIRIDQLNYKENSGYLIRKMTGLYESFEREYYDLIRAAFLKYNFQARIGDMDGVFVAYHNTARIFGFQYVPVTEMEERIYGPGPSGRGERIFEKCVGLMEVLFKKIIACFPGQSLSCTIEAREGAGNLKAWVVPLHWNENEPKPIAELTVTISHTINDEPVSRKIAIDRANENWVLRYKISRSNKSKYKMWSALREAQSRQFTLNLPAGMTKETMDSKLAAVNYGAGIGLELGSESLTERPGQPLPGETEELIKPTKRFSKPSRKVQHLRNLAKAGKAEIERQENRGKRQVVWGRDADVSHPAAGQGSAVETIEDDAGWILHGGSAVGDAESTPSKTPQERNDLSAVDDSEAFKNLPDEQSPIPQGLLTQQVQDAEPALVVPDDIEGCSGGVTSPETADPNHRDDEAATATGVPAARVHDLYARFHL